MRIVIEILKTILEILGAVFLLLLIFGKKIEIFLNKRRVSGENAKVEVGEQVTAVLRKEKNNEKRTISARQNQ